MWGQMIVSGSNSWYVYLFNYTDLDACWLWTNLVGAEDDLLVFCAFEAANTEDDDDVPGDTEFYDMIFKDDSNEDIDITWYEEIDGDAEEFFDAYITFVE